MNGLFGNHELLGSGAEGKSDPADGQPEGRPAHPVKRAKQERPPHGLAWGFLQHHPKLWNGQPSDEHGENEPADRGLSQPVSLPGPPAGGFLRRVADGRGQRTGGVQESSK